MNTAPEQPLDDVDAKRSRASFDIRNHLIGEALRRRAADLSVIRKRRVSSSEVVEEILAAALQPELQHLEQLEVQSVAEAKKPKKK